MAVLSDVIGRGTLASRPASGSTGELYFATDEGKLYRWSGSAWQLVDVHDLIAAKGDLLVGSAADTLVVKTVGANDTVLTADSTVAGGVKWAATAAGLGAWTTYTPTWTASSSNPVLGNGTLLGRYKALDANTYIISVQVSMGSTTTYGSGTWRFALPAGVTTAAREQVMSAVSLDLSLVILASGIVRFAASSTRCENVVIGSGIVNATTPHTWANGDFLAFTGIIEVA